MVYFLPITKAPADAFSVTAYTFSERPPGYEITAAPQERPEAVKTKIVRQWEFEMTHMPEEMVAGVERSPLACQKSHRVMLRKRMGIEKGGERRCEGHH